MRASLHQPRHGATGTGGRGPSVSGEAALREGAFLDRQAYRLRLARDSLVRELTRVGVEPGAEELEAMLTRKLQRKLLRTLRALEKIEEGTYGLCEVTGLPITRSRLEQVPEEIERPEGRRLLRVPGGGVRACGP